MIDLNICLIAAKLNIKSYFNVN